VAAGGGDLHASIACGWPTTSPMSRRVGGRRDWTAGDGAATTGGREPSSTSTTSRSVPAAARARSISAASRARPPHHQAAMPATAHLGHRESSRAGPDLSAERQLA